jgi:hypothetical protein
MTLRARQSPNRPLVAVDPRDHVRRWRQSLVVRKVVGEVSKLDLAREFVVGQAFDVLLITVLPKVRKFDDRIDDGSRDTGIDQIVDRQRRVLENVVKHCGHPGGAAIDRHHHPKEMQDVRFALRGGILLAAVSHNGKLDSLL